MQTPRQLPRSGNSRSACQRLFRPHNVCGRLPPWSGKSRLRFRFLSLVCNLFPQSDCPKRQTFARRRFSNRRHRGLCAESFPYRHNLSSTLHYRAYRRFHIQSFPDTASRTCYTIYPPHLHKVQPALPSSVSQPCPDNPPHPVREQNSAPGHFRPPLSRGPDG